MSAKSIKEVGATFTNGRMARQILKPSKWLMVRYGTRMAELFRLSLMEGLDTNTGQYKSAGYSSGALSRSIKTSFSADNARWSTGGYFTDLILSFKHLPYGWDLAEGKRTKTTMSAVIAWIRRKKANGSWTTWTGNRHSKNGSWTYKDIAWVVIKRKTSIGNSYKWNDVSLNSPASNRFLAKQKAVRPYWLGQFRDDIKTNIQNYNANGK